MSGNDRDRILAFSHIPKTAGTTMQTLLQRNFGMTHLAVRHRSPTVVYTTDDLRFDLRLMPWARSIAGHALKPFEDFGEYEGRLAWYTMLRDPIRRFVSHYQHQYVGGRDAYRLSFREWMRTHVRQNWMVRMMAGEEDLDAAKRILEEKVRFVGIVERFDESLLLFSDRFGLERFEVDYPRAVNRARSSEVRDRIAEAWPEFEDEVKENNALDIELYEYALREIWPFQVDAYGADRLARDVDRTFRGRPPSPGSRARRLAYRVHRTLVYKPAVRLQLALGYG